MEDFIYKEKSITVGELVTMLNELPQDAPVKLEGCDCYGDASGAYVEIVESEAKVFITRTDGVDWDDRRRLAESRYAVRKA